MDDPQTARQENSKDTVSQVTSEPGEQPGTSEVPTNTPPAPVETPKWPFVLFAVLLVVALGGGWILYQRAQAPLPTPQLIPPPTPAARLASPTPTPAASEDEQTRMLETQGASDEVSVIEADLNTTSLTTLDAELKDIDQEASSL